MKEYKVETLVFHTKLTLDKNHIIKTSKLEIQEKLDAYAINGWQLVSTNASNYGASMYIYLYFEK